MRVPTISAATVVRPSARPQLLPGDGVNAALLIHGFTGYPGEMLYLGRRLQAAGFTVAVPRLPGHGTNGSDFLHSGAQDWLRRCIDQYLELASTSERVCVAGLSMGGLLAIILAALFHPARIALAAPALRVFNRGIHLTPLLRPIITRLARNVEGEAAEGDPDRQELAREYWGWDWIGQSAELLRLRRMAVRLLPRVESATLTIVSKGDRTVPPDVAGLIEARIAARERRTVVLERSPHVVVNDVEKEAVADEIVAWFGR